MDAAVDLAWWLAVGARTEELVESIVTLLVEASDHVQAVGLLQGAASK
jgi:hypothetical protein